ncbi:Oidioi.mRNA.OKI2018_I69.chr2.g6316.t1.cds [Oikopleura dioica]|uniref:Oidioi.mRNA.OKI2018_I69.chr2.g6316.t1.cds n=1 Tax=Oikopleura dioica TaxID=34765 RepID=A0ABN7T944_OIKDI|nr:Oidioi.mRNA.OKI2018_I69.chr2.g6316.t1.cds [Oikopleura dioica]
MRFSNRRRPAIVKVEKSLLFEPIIPRNSRIFQLLQGHQIIIKERKDCWQTPSDLSWDIDFDESNRAEFSDFSQSDPYENASISTMSKAAFDEDIDLEMMDDGISTNSGGSNDINNDQSLSEYEERSFSNSSAIVYEWEDLNIDEISALVRH